MRNAMNLAVLMTLLMGIAVATQAADDNDVTLTLDEAASLYLKIRLDETPRLSHMKPGEVVNGVLARNVYAPDRQMFSMGERVQLTVDHTEKRKRMANDHWPAVVKAFTPRYESYPVFKLARVSGIAGDTDLRVVLLSVSQRREVFARARNKAGAGAVETSAGKSKISDQRTTWNHRSPIMVLEGFSEKESVPGSACDPVADINLARMEGLAAGTRLRVMLLGEVSASKSRAGDAFVARLLEPVLIDSQVAIPAGALLDGKIVKHVPPRWGSRAGSLSLGFSGLTLRGGKRIPISASLASAEVDGRSHTRIDREGQLHGERPGKAWMAINLGVTAGLAKEADDATQLIVEALVATATDASTAGVSRIVSGCVSGIYMVSRHGRDIVLPRFTELSIALDRPIAFERASSGVRTVTAARH